MLLLVQERLHRQLGWRSTVEPIQQPNALKSFEVSQSRHKFRKDFDRAFHALRHGALYRSARGLPKRRMNRADDLEDQIAHADPTSRRPEDGPPTPLGCSPCAAG